MASVATDKKGNRRVQFTAPDGVRKTLYLGKTSKKSAENLKRRVEELLECLVLKRPMEPNLAEWVSRLEPLLSKKFARVGLIQQPKQKGETTIGEHLDDLFARRRDVKESTRIHWGHTKRCLLDYFGADRLLTYVTVGDARDWERWLRTGKARRHPHGKNKSTDGLALNTVRKRVSNAKQFFQDAVDREILQRNPFAKLKGTVGNNPARDYYVTRDEAQKVIDACPDAEWRLIFALSRYGGLRCPSEHLALKWEDIQWSENRFLVRSKKTEHHEGKGTRIVPIFPELRPYLNEVWDAAEDGTEFVITRYRSTNANLRTQLKRIIKKAGLIVWPKLFHNLRASRATELANEFPQHVATAWMGHSAAIAGKHYWRVTEDDFNKASKCNAENDAQPTQKGTQPVTASNRGERNTLTKPVETSDVMRNDAKRNLLLHIDLVGDEGLEPPTLSV